MRGKGQGTVCASSETEREGVVLSHFEFEGFRTVMPAQAGIQGEQAAASGYSAWIPAFAGMTQHSSTPQNHHDRLLNPGLGRRRMGKRENQVAIITGASHGLGKEV